MIIDLLNRCNVKLSAEAFCLFQMQEHHIHVLPFFCVSRDTTEEELNQYLFNHFRYTKEFSVWLSIPDTENTASVPQESDRMFHYDQVLKSILYRYMQRIFQDSEAYVREKGIPENRLYIIVQERPAAKLIGKIETACTKGVLNETIVTMFQADQPDPTVPYSIFCSNDDDGVWYSYEPDLEEKFDRAFLRKIFSIGTKLKQLFQNSRLCARFLIHEETRKFHIYDVQKIAELVDSGEDSIVLSSRLMVKYYPGVVSPLYASVAKTLASNISSDFLRAVTRKNAQDSELTDLVKCVNGRMYFHMNRFRKLQRLIGTSLYIKSFEEEPKKAHPTKLSERWIAHPLRMYNTQKKIDLLLERTLSEHERNQERFEAFLEEMQALCLQEIPFQTMYSVFENVLFELGNCIKYDLYYSMLMQRNQVFMELPSVNSKRKQRIVQQNARAEACRIAMHRIHREMRLFSHRLAAAGGQALQQNNCISEPEDIFFLDLRDMCPLKDNAYIDLRDVAARRKQAFAGFVQMPNFTRLVFYREMVDANIQKVTTLELGRETAKFLGCGVCAGTVTKRAVICTDSVIPADADRSTVCIAKQFSPELLTAPIGGLILEEPAIFADIDAAAVQCSFPVVVGIEHACTILQDGDQVTLDGVTGEVQVYRSLAS